MRFKIIILNFLFFLSNTSLFSQIYGSTNSWFLNLNRIQLNEKWSFTNEIHERTGKFLKEQGQFIIRPSVDYHFNENLEASFGYSFLHFSSYAPYELPISRMENNIWEQILLKADIGKIKVQHRFRQENRWLDEIIYSNGEYKIDGAKFSNRFRYRLTCSFDFFKFKNSEKSLFLNLFDELWFVQDKYLRPTSFARNWL